MTERGAAALDGLRHELLKAGYVIEKRDGFMSIFAREWCLGCSRWMKPPRGLKRFIWKCQRARGEPRSELCLAAQLNHPPKAHKRSPDE